MSIVNENYARGEAHSTVNLVRPPGMTAGSWDSVSSDAVGGSAFFALSFLELAELVHNAVEAR